MMNQDRVILIKGDHTKWYEQAIFIMNKNVPANKIPVDFVAEAEKIINGRAGGAATLPSREKRAGKGSGSFDLFMNVLMLLGCLALAGVMAYSYFS